MTEQTCVVFDIGNVLIRWDPAAAIGAAVGADRAARFLADAEFDFRAWNHQMDAGRSWGEAEDEAAARFPHYADEIRAYRQHFGQSLTGGLEDSWLIAADLMMAGVPTFALTNWSADLFHHATDRCPVLGRMQGILVSGRVGVAKPDPRIWDLLTDLTGRPAGYHVFIDDTEVNVESARRAGLDAIHFTAPAQLRGELLTRGLLIP